MKRPKRASRRPSIIAAYLVVIVLLSLTLTGLWVLVNELRGSELLRFRTPGAFVLLLGAVLVAVVGFHWQLPRRASFWFSRVDELLTTQVGRVSRFARLPTALRVTALVLITIALARPETLKDDARTTRGIDIMFVLDLSKSMEEQERILDETLLAWRDGAEQVDDILVIGVQV